MNVIALLNWYDEPISWLAETVASTAKLCSHVVAVDGAYALFPGALRKPTSGPEQAETIARTARGCGLGFTIYTPCEPWWGNEIAKRDVMIQLALAVADPGDWLLIIDADEALTTCPSDTRARLEQAGDDVAEVMMWERNAQREVSELVDASPDYRWMIRRLFRAQDGLRVEHTHYTVTVGDRLLVGDGADPCVSLPDVVLEHRTGLRSTYRRRQKREFEADRDRLGIEQPPVAVVGG